MGNASRLLCRGKLAELRRRATARPPPPHSCEIGASVARRFFHFFPIPHAEAQATVGRGAVDPSGQARV